MRKIEKMDASGAVSVLEREATIATLALAGVKVRNWWSIGAELQVDWHIDEAKGWPYAMVFREHLPSWATCWIQRRPIAMDRWSRQKRKFNLWLHAINILYYSYPLFILLSML